MSEMCPKLLTLSLKGRLIFNFNIFCVNPLLNVTTCLRRGFISFLLIIFSRELKSMLPLDNNVLSPDRKNI